MRSLHSSKIWLIAAVAAMILCAGSALNACPNCKEGFANDTKQAQTGEGYSWSVLFMLVMITGVGCGFTMKIAYHLKKAQG